MLARIRFRQPQCLGGRHYAAGGHGADGHEHAAADDKRQGRGDAGHEVAHDAGGDALLLGRQA